MIDTQSSSSSNITVVIGDCLNLSCTSQGSLPATFTWRKDNDTTVLQSSNIPAVNHSETSVVFYDDYIISKVNTSDSGTYICNVTNSIGTDSTTFTVAVISKLLK